MNRWKISLVLLCVPGVTSVAQAQASPSQAKVQNIVTVSQAGESLSMWCEYYGTAEANDSASGTASLRT